MSGDFLSTMAESSRARSATAQAKIAESELRARVGRETTLEEIFLDLVAQKEMDIDAGVDAAA